MFTFHMTSRFNSHVYEKTEPYWLPWNRNTDHEALLCVPCVLLQKRSWEWHLEMRGWQPTVCKCCFNYFRVHFLKNVKMSAPAFLSLSFRHWEELVLVALAALVQQLYVCPLGQMLNFNVLRTRVLAECLMGFFCHTTCVVINSAI